MTETVVLAGDDLGPAIELLSESIGEIPMYGWLLGEHITDRGLREWLAEILVRPLLNAGCVLGSRHDGQLVGMVIWQPHDVDLSPDGTPPLTPADFTRLATVPGVRERMVELLTGPQLPRPAADAVDLRIAAVSAAARGSRAMTDMMREVEKFCVTTSRPYYAWTGSPRLRDWYSQAWGASVFAVEEWNGITMYGLVSERPPRPRPESARYREISSPQRRSSSPIV
ncbi:MULTISPECIES: hypothetical protein [Gordonia]|uniref:N-acetyltransferase domain-containing protein n=1 Tax=Gordonia amicalis TaxID=89053 RepID=A0ABU4D8W2_9ACTN|nr:MULTISPECIES: hypothetical protein [Gordonia]ATD70856.1 hypothetical protein CNO18_11840 [Gordonia sp. 1D]MCZ0913198.1 hypothetical protein [Gordonia amicalis]MCZ4577904.1 hypothetical protein [Gordonia amicalis]MCZ4652524.1 hypothetical protein [Gordonia amicalis]MDJ0451101.1 hypothetical protein [Gordonia amicalis]